MSLDPPIPIVVGDRVLYDDTPFSSRVLHGVVAKLTRRMALLKIPTGTTTIYRSDVLGVTPRCASRHTPDRCQRADGHEGKHFAHTSFGTMRWSDVKKGVQGGKSTEEQGEKEIKPKLSNVTDPDLARPEDRHPRDERWIKGNRYDRRRCDYCFRWIGVNVRAQHYRVCPSKVRALKDEALGAKALGYAICDRCPLQAVNRWYAGSGRSETIAHTLCKKHDEDLRAENARNRERLGLG